jgi:GAF domain-containing protein
MLRERFGVCARILSPIFIGNDLVAWISVYESDNPRDWRETDVEIIERAAKQAQEAIESAIQESTPAVFANSNTSR